MTKTIEQEGKTYYQLSIGTGLLERDKLKAGSRLIAIVWPRDDSSAVVSHHRDGWYWRELAPEVGEVVATNKLSLNAVVDNMNAAKCEDDPARAVVLEMSVDEAKAIREELGPQWHRGAVRALLDALEGVE